MNCALSHSPLPSPPITHPLPQSLFLKTSDSVALPIYQALPQPSAKIE